MKLENMEQGVCPNCGSVNVKLKRIEKEVNIVIWYECQECECEFIEGYSFDVKGIVGGDAD